MGRRAKALSLRLVIRPWLPAVAPPRTVAGVARKERFSPVSKHTRRPGPLSPKKAQKNKPFTTLFNSIPATKGDFRRRGLVIL
ncbi:hypothetical protein V6Z11_D07G222600 [Gossypium hirsutum]